MATVLTDLGSVVTSIVGVGGNVVTFVTASPVLLIPFAFGLIGGAVALFKRLK